MNVTLVVPRGAEAAAVRRAGIAAPIVTIAAGARAARDLPAIAPGHVVIMLGLCGALRARRAGDIVVYRTLAGEAAAPPLDAELAASALAVLPQAHAVRACTSTHVITRAPEREAVAGRYDAEVVDMESAALAQAFAARGVRFAIVRVVSDDATRDLPALEHVIDANGKLHAGRIALAFVRDPQGAVAFIGSAQRALRQLTVATRALRLMTA